MERDVAALRNADVEWHGTAVGFHPELASERAKAIAAAPAETVIPALMAAISDPAQFVAAHVLLTRLSGLEYQAFPLWNGLRVDIQADGHTFIEPAQGPVLARRWQLWHEVSPHPKALPGGG